MRRVDILFTHASGDNQFYGDFFPFFSLGGFHFNGIVEKCYLNSETNSILKVFKPSLQKNFVEIKFAQ